jgi:hypothetical protein
MADPLKKGIGTKYLLPIIGCYVGAAAALGADADLKRLVPEMVGKIGIAGLGGLALLVFQDLVPRSLKEVLIFWRLRERLPGYRAFSVIAVKDMRVDREDLAILLPSRQMLPAEQNALWYRWLKSVESDPAIADNHHRLLALRESAVLLLLLAVFSAGWFALQAGADKDRLILCGTCVVLYLLTASAARNCANRLVGNVIARKVATS